VVVEQTVALVAEQTVVEVVEQTVVGVAEQTALVVEQVMTEAAFLAVQQIAVEFWDQN